MLRIIKPYLSALMLVLVFNAPTASSQGDTNEEIKIVLEEPESAGVYTGISNVRGWAVAQSGIEKVEAYIDGDYAFDIPMGGSRGDVGELYPDYPGSSLSGFSMALNYKLLSAGEHELLVKAISEDGSEAEKSAVFVVERFIGSFIRDPADFALRSVTEAFVVGDELVVRGATVEGEQWDFTLSFNTATQGLEISKISESTEPIKEHEGLFRPGNYFLYEIDYFEEDDFSDNACGGICETFQSWMSVSAGEKDIEGEQNLLVSIETTQGFLDGSFYFDKYGSLMEFGRLLSSHRTVYFINPDDPDSPVSGMPLTLSDRDKSEIKYTLGLWLPNNKDEVTRVEFGSSRRLGNEIFFEPALGGEVETQVTLSEKEIEMAGDEFGVSGRTYLEVSQRVWWSEQFGLFRMQIDTTKWTPCSLGGGLCPDDISWTWQLIDYDTP